MTHARKLRPFLPALSVAAALAAGAVQAQDLPRSVPLCSLDQELPLAPRVLNRIRARADFEDLLRYASANCAEVALLLADTATATVPGGDAETDDGTGVDREDRDDRNPRSFPEAEDPPAEDPPAEDPPAEDPPAEDPPAEDPPAEDPPAEDPPAEDPPAEDPPAEDPPAEDPPAEDPPAEDPPAEDPPAEDPPAEDPPAEDPPAEDPPADDNTGGGGWNSWVGGQGG